jgi:hypothetical protein
MNRYSAALAALFVVRLILPISAASAQIAPGDVEMPTGDVWPSREERVHIPQNALVPKSVDRPSLTRSGVWLCIAAAEAVSIVPLSSDVRVSIFGPPALRSLL